MSPIKMNKHTENLIPIIILNWNGEDDTIECLNSINQSKKSRFFAVLVDNGSAPESIAILKNKCKIIYRDILFFNKAQILNIQDSMITRISDSLTEESLVFIENGENLGFAQGNNIGIKFAELIQAEWVMLLNNDTVVQKNTFLELHKFINSNSYIKAVTPQIRYYEPDTKVWNCGGKLTYLGSRKYYFAEMDHLKVPQTGCRKITFITGCALLFKFKETGPLTEKFFFGEEDYEFSLRMKKNDINMACVYDAIIYHKVGSSIKKHSDTLNSIYVFYISRLLDTRDYYSILHWMIIKMAIYLYIPLLLIKNRINPLRALNMIRRIHSYVKNNDSVNRAEYRLS
jgi:GT2 family glycosyltransferase